MAADELPNGAELAGCTVLRLLGRGSHSWVYLAQRRDGAQPVAPPVALKVMAVNRWNGIGDENPLQQAFVHSARLAIQLRHPDLIKVLDCGVQTPWAWLTMQAVPGSDLSRYTRRPRLLPLNLVLQLGQRLARALAHVHRLGVIHRDVKPSNVLVHWPTQTVKLTDFGLAQAGGGGHTGTGLLLGSPAYMAPEQLTGGALSPATDLYALGVTLYELLAGQPAFMAQTMGELMRQITQEPAPNLAHLQPELPLALTRLLQGLMAKEAQDRPGDGDALAQQLAAMGAATPPLPPLPPKQAGH